MLQYGVCVYTCALTSSRVESLFGTRILVLIQYYMSGFCLFSRKGEKDVASKGMSDYWLVVETYVNFCHEWNLVSMFLFSSDEGFGLPII